MDILLYKDGHLSISESPLQGKENNLDDVVMLVSNPQEGDTLTYKGGKWVNGEGGGGGGGGAMVLTVTHTTDGNNDIYTLNKTWKEIKDALAAGTQVVLYGEGTGEDYEGMYFLFNVFRVEAYDGDYIINDMAIDVAMNSYCYAQVVLGKTDTLFITDSENGYPSITVNNK